MGLVYPDVFHQVGILASYIPGEWVYTGYQQAERLPLKVFINHGTYDGKAGSPPLRDIMDKSGYTLLYLETLAGHNFYNVRGFLDDMLIYLFGMIR